MRSQSKKCAKTTLCLNLKPCFGFKDLPVKDKGLTIESLLAWLFPLNVAAGHQD
jgi:hypothetical protein